MSQRYERESFESVAGVTDPCLAAVRVFLAATAFGVQPRAWWRLRSTRANGRPAFAVYRATSLEGPYEPFGIQTVLFANGKVCEITTFAQAELLRRFGMPST